MRFLSLLLLVLFTSCSQKIYIVRHGEKAVPNSEERQNMKVEDPELSEAGKTRAALLKSKLSGKNIGHIFSTRYKRNVQTAEPLALAKNIQIEFYNPNPNQAKSFFAKIDSIRNKNILIVGHSNTVDDLVNTITGQTHVKGDLPETEYNNLYILTRKGNTWKFRNEKFGEPPAAEKK